MKVFYTFTLSIIFLLLDKSNFAFATTIVAVVTSKNVILATDSRLINMPAQLGKKRFEEVTKIVKSNCYYFAVSGLVENSRKTFNLNRIISKHLKQGAFEEALVKIRAEVGQILFDELQYISQYRPEVLAELQRYSSNMASFIIVGADNGAAFAKMMQFKIVNGNSLELQENIIHSKPYDDFQTMVIGQSGGVAKVFNSMKMSEIRMTPEQWAEYLIKKQSEETPDWVSPPVDIVRVAGCTVEWIKRKEGCPLEYN